MKRKLKYYKANKKQSRIFLALIFLCLFTTISNSIVPSYFWDHNDEFTEVFETSEEDFEDDKNENEDDEYLYTIPKKIFSYNVTRLIFDHYKNDWKCYYPDILTPPPKLI